MTNLTRNLTLLLHMQNYCNEIIETMKKYKYDFEKFDNDYIFKNSISMEIFQIGELANHLTADYRNETEEQAKWHEIISMRNFVAHGYSKMDAEVIFKAAKNDVPNLLKFIKKETPKLSVKQ